MFEYDQDAVDSLLEESSRFRHMFDKYATLKTRVAEANEGDLQVDEMNLEKMKKEKLLLKDQMAAMIQNYRTMHA